MKYVEFEHKMIP